MYYSRATNVLIINDPSGYTFYGIVPSAFQNKLAGGASHEDDLRDKRAITEYRRHSK